MEKEDFKLLFLEESFELLAESGSVLLDFERDPQNIDIINKLFRIVHTIKGSAASMAYDNATELTHELENLLDVYRNRRGVPTKDSIDCIFNCLDMLTRIIEKIDECDSDDFDVTECKTELRKWAEQRSENPQITDNRIENTTDNQINGFLKEEEEKLVRERVGVENVFHVELSFDKGDLKSARCFLVSTRLSAQGEILCSYPDADDDDALDVMNAFHLILATGSEKADIETNVLELGVERVVINDVTEASLKKLVDKRRFQNEEPESRFSRHRANGKLKKSEEVETSDSSKIKSARTIRVDVQRLDDIMALFGELVINMTQLKEVKKSLIDIEETLIETEGTGQALQKTRDLKSEYEKIILQSGRISNELQEKVMKVRMMPVETVFSRYQRTVRELSAKLGKIVELEIEGQDTELEKTVLEAIADPLTHIVRNCVSHGIENPEIRETLGKDRKGVLRLSAKYEGNSAIIEISDDGRGISPGKLRQSAVQKGILSKEEADRMDDREALNLIFRPNFSTAAEVSDVSGRGVGMDVVAKTLESLNAMIDIRTFEDEGTTFILSFPLSLSIIQALLIEAAGQVFAIPMSNIREVLKIPQGDLRNVDGKDVVMLRNNILSLVYAKDILDIEADEKDDKYLFIVVVGWGHRWIGIVVDALKGRQELVVKSLDEYFSDSSLIESASVLVDGSVALILSPKNIIESIAN